MHAPAPSPTALVGRDRELGILRQHLDAALAGQGSLMLISGEAGIGKTALAEVVCRQATKQGALVLIGRCYDLSETPPYGPWVELFGRYPLSENGPSLPDAFLQSGSTVAPVTSQGALFQQVLGFFTALAASRPVLLLLDDLHWSDSASLELLRVVARSLTALPMVVVATYRSDDLTRRHPLYQLLPALVREAHATRLNLQPLDDAAVAALVTARYGLTTTETIRLIAFLQERAEGNAFFLEELLRSLEEGGTLREDGAGWVLHEPIHLGVPPLLRQVIDARVARLDRDAQEWLAIAAIIGQEVSLRTWAIVIGIAEDGLAPTIEQAVAAHLLEETPEGTGVRFIHALTREAINEAVSPLRRRGLHRQVGEALMRESTPDPDAVAHHLRQAGDSRAAEWLTLAGDRARRTFAYQIAAERYEAALGLLDAIHEVEQQGWLLYRAGLVYRRSNPQHGLDYLENAIRVADAIGDSTLAAASHFARAFCHSTAAQLDQAVPEMTEAVRMLEALSPAEHRRLNHDAGLMATVDSKTWRGTLVLNLAHAGRFAEAVALGEEFAVHVAEPPIDGELHGVAYGGGYLGLGLAQAMLGRPEAAERAFARAHAVFIARDNDQGVSQAALSMLITVSLPYRADHVAERDDLAAVVTAAYLRLSESNLIAASRDGISAQSRHWLMLVAGEWNDASADAVKLVDHPNGLVQQEWRAIRGWLAREQGKPEQAWIEVRRTLPEGPATLPGAVVFTHATALQRVAVSLALDTGDFDAARAWAEAHDRWIVWSEAVLGQSEGQLLWAQYYRAVGDTERATRHAMTALSHATAPRQPLALLAAHRLLGGLATDAGHTEDAAIHLTKSFALADACAAPYERALTLLALADLHILSGDRAGTFTALDEVRTICVPLGAKPALAGADVLTTRLTSTPPSFPAGLSGREVEVLRLLASGKTNREIAETLFLSERTIDAHVRNIFTKTRADNRAAATAFAYKHDLAGQ